MKTIVLGYDDSESAKRALTRVTELADAFDAYVIAVSRVVQACRDRGWV